VEGFIFPVKTSFAGSKIHLLARGATFCGSTSFKNTQFVRGINDFDDTLFSGMAEFEDAVFFIPVFFKNAKFNEFTQFNQATFKVTALFDDAVFSEICSFGAVTVDAEALFRRTKFQKMVVLSGSFLREAQFNDAIFSDETIFSSSRFGQDVFFDRATFAGVLRFDNVVFDKISSFVDTTMKGVTTFTGVQYTSSPPKFAGVKLHQGTTWYRIKWPTAPVDAKEAETFISAYEYLKLEMDRLKKHQDELEFFALELQSRRVFEGYWRGMPIALYGYLCRHGRSYFRPLVGLLVTIIIGALLLLPHFTIYKYNRAIGLSVANTLGVLGFRREFIGADTLASFSNLMVVLAGLQLIFGAVFLFLFGLALRNRFRMK
jgi:hypothetical protein